MEDVKKGLETLLKGLDMTVSSLDANLKKVYEGIGEEHAIAFAKALKDNNIDEQLKSVHKTVNDLKSGFNF